MKRTRTYTHAALDAARMLGHLIRLERKERRMTEVDLADRAGISRTTLRKIESGDMGCEIGIVFEVAVLAGVKLFDSEDQTTASLHWDRLVSRLAVLPARVRAPKVDDEF